MKKLQVSVLLPIQVMSSFSQDLLPFDLECFYGNDQTKYTSYTYKKKAANLICLLACTIYLSNY